jgi:transcription factor IIIB 90 kDa subunit
VEAVSAQIAVQLLKKGLFLDRCTINLFSNIVSEVTFVEGTNGASSVVGQFISSATGLPVSYGKSGGLGRGFRKGGYGMSKESREATIENGRRKISQVAATLKLSTHHIEAAQRLFMLAVQHNFIQGRKTQNVIAACLYIVCRREKTPHLLIDFSDVLQVTLKI